jgi:plastocyanin
MPAEASMPKPYIVLSLATTILVIGCGGGGSECCDPFDQSTISKTAGDAQAGVVGQQLPTPLQVTVTTGGTPSAGITINWSTTAAGATLDPTSAVTDAAGVATTSWTLGTSSGPQTATAALTGGSGTPVTFTATAQPAEAATLAKAPGLDGDNQTGEINTVLPIPLAAKVTDVFGNPVPEVAVNWAATGAAVSAATTLTAGGGIAEVGVTLGPAAGGVTITAAVDGLDGSPLTFAATATEPAAIPTTAAVTVRDNNFLSVRNLTSNTAVDTVAVGGSVTWTWAASTGGTHNITSSGPPDFTGRSTVAPPPLPDPYTVVFAAPGTYNYYCTFHGSPGSGMSGRIVVR